MSLSMSPYASGGGGGYDFSPDVGTRQHVQLPEQPHRPRSDVSVLIADVAARRALRSRERSMDTDTVRRGTPMSDRRQAVSQPRFLQSELDADGPGSPAPGQSFAAAANVNAAGSCSLVLVQCRCFSLSLAFRLLSSV